MASRIECAAYLTNWHSSLSVREKEFTMLEGRALYAQMIVDERRREQRQLAAIRPAGKRFFRLSSRLHVRVAGNR